jgi:hypothetical protein
MISYPRIPTTAASNKEEVSNLGVVAWRQLLLLLGRLPQEVVGGGGEEAEEQH